MNIWFVCGKGNFPLLLFQQSRCYGVSFVWTNPLIPVYNNYFAWFIYCCSLSNMCCVAKSEWRCVWYVAAGHIDLYVERRNRGKLKRTFERKTYIKLFGYVVKEFVRRHSWSGIHPNQHKSYKFTRKSVKSQKSSIEEEFSNILQVWNNCRNAVREHLQEASS